MADDCYEDIVNNFDGPMLVLAGPGSGKTYMLADRVTRLLKAGFSKNQIAALAFGRDAQRNMYKRLVDPSGNFKLRQEDLPHISTMHSLGLEIVFANARKVRLRKSHLAVLADNDAKKLLYRDAALMIGHGEQDAISAGDCKTNGDCEPHRDRATCKICERYREIMRICDRIDFDDQILLACQILEDNPNILANYQAEAQHLLINEYQDINAAQFRLIELLSRKHRGGLFAVGDDAQSIYSFRGGDPEFIRRFKDDFVDAAMPPLPNSRRCPKEIMEDAFKVLEKYYTGWTGRPSLKYFKTDCEPPQIKWGPSEKKEAELIAQITRDCLPEKTVLILAPKQDFFPLISKALSGLGVPHELTLDLLPRRMRVIKRVIDWVQNPHDNFNTRTLVEDLINTGVARVPGANKARVKREDTRRTRIAVEEEIARLWQLVDRKTSLFSAIVHLEDAPKVIVSVRHGLLRMLDSYHNAKGPAEGDFARALSIIPGVWGQPQKLCGDISAVVELLGRQSCLGPGSVELKTMHKAKGLEADVVIMAGLEDDIVPSPAARSSSQLAEEARRFYVSMTRSSQELILLHSWQRPRNISYGVAVTDKPRSRFLDALGRRSEYVR